MPENNSNHDSRRGTESGGYQKLREAGIGHSDAQRIARQASEQVHRQIDRQHTDRGRR